MSDWKQSFSQKVKQVQGQWVKQFEDALDNHVVPAFDDVATFVRNHGFNTSVPMRDEGRRSFKFELAENAYLLLIFRSTAIGEFELRCESFTPGAEPHLSKSVERLSDIKDDWAQQQFEAALDSFIDSLSGEQAPAEEEVAVA